MRLSFILTHHSYLSIWLAAMSAAADSGAYTHERPHLTSSEFDLDLELGLTRDVYDYETQEVRQPVSARLAELLVTNSP
jgi:hypothetical protein